MTLALCCLSSDSDFAWTQWNHFGCIKLQPGGMEGPGGPTETLMKAQADKMVSSGMAKAGYLYINIVRAALTCRLPTCPPASQPPCSCVLPRCPLPLLPCSPGCSGADRAGHIAGRLLAADEPHAPLGEPEGSANRQPLPLPERHEAPGPPAIPPPPHHAMHGPAHA